MRLAFPNPYLIQSHDLVNIQAVAQGSYLHLNYKKREISIYFWVRLRHFLGQALQTGQARGPRAVDRLGGQVLQLGQAREPGAAAT